MIELGLILQIGLAQECWTRVDLVFLFSLIIFLYILSISLQLS